MQNVQYLVKWAGYHKNQSTWEPSSHLSPELISSYFTPSVCSVRLDSAAHSLETAFQQRLSSGVTRVTAQIDLDVFRYVFNTDKSVIVSNYTDLTDKLALSENWFYKIKSSGNVVKISLPMRLTPSLRHKSVWIMRNGAVERSLQPVEKVTICCALEPMIV